MSINYSKIELDGYCREEKKERYKKVGNIQVFDSQSLLIRLVITCSMKLIFEKSFKGEKKGSQEEYLVERTSLDKNNRICRSSESQTCLG